jgi:hypothetical protein
MFAPVVHERIAQSTKASEQASRQPGPPASKQASKRAVERATERASKQTSQQASKQTSKQASKQARQQASKQASKQSAGMNSDVICQSKRLMPLYPLYTLGEDQIYLYKFIYTSICIWGERSRGWRELHPPSPLPRRRYGPPRFAWVRARRSSFHQSVTTGYAAVGHLLRKALIGISSSDKPSVTS